MLMLMSKEIGHVVIVVIRVKIYLKVEHGQSAFLHPLYFSLEARQLQAVEYALQLLFICSGIEQRGDKHIAAYPVF